MLQIYLLDKFYPVRKLINYHLIGYSQCHNCQQMQILMYGIIRAIRVVSYNKTFSVVHGTLAVWVCLKRGLTRNRHSHNLT